MNNNSPVVIDVSSLTHLTELLVAHGVYAIFVFLLFYLERSAAKNVRDAKDGQEREFFEKKYSLVLYSVVIGAIVVTGIWLWTNFLYHDKVVLEGSLEGLRRETSEPVAPGDMSILDRVAAFGDVSFYTHEKSSDLGEDPEIDWALVSPRSDSESIELKFEHECQFLPPGKSAVIIIGSPSEDSKLKPERVPPQLKRARLDLKAYQALAKKKIELLYHPDRDEPCKNAGKLYIVAEKGPVELPWLPEVSSNKAQASNASIFGASTAWAEPLKGPAPKLTSEVTAHLAEQLASHDLEKQLAAQEILVANGAGSFHFIEEQLKLGTLRGAAERARLVQSLTVVVEKIEASGGAAPPSLELALAKALYEVGNYQRSSRVFDKIQASDLSQEFTLLRGAADTYTGNYDRALASFDTYLKNTKRPQDKSLALANIGSVRLLQGQTSLARRSLSEAVELDSANKAARINLGRVELREGHYDAAATIFSNLLKTDPDRVDLKVNLALAYQRNHKEDEAIKLLEGIAATSPNDATVLNNLAYLYTLKNMQPERALAYADQALKSSPDNASFLDTKGFALYRLGKFSESLKVLQSAQERNPQDSQIQEHITAVRGAIRPTESKEAKKQLRD